MRAHACRYERDKELKSVRMAESFCGDYSFLKGQKRSTVGRNLRMPKSLIGHLNPINIALGLHFSGLCSNFVKRVTAINSACTIVTLV